MSVRISPDRRHRLSVNNDPLGFAPVSSFLKTSLVSRSSGLLAFYLFGVLALCFLPDFRWVLGFSRLYLVYTVCFRDGLESLFNSAYLR